MSRFWQLFWKYVFISVLLSVVVVVSLLYYGDYSMLKTIAIDMVYLIGVLYFVDNALILWLLSKMKKVEKVTGGIFHDTYHEIMKTNAELRILALVALVIVALLSWYDLHRNVIMVLSVFMLSILIDYILITRDIVKALFILNRYQKIFQK